MYYVRLIYNIFKVSSNLCTYQDFRVKLCFFFSFNDKFVIYIMTNAMHTMYTMTCSVSVKIYWRKNKLQLQLHCVLLWRFNIQPTAATCTPLNTCQQTDTFTVTTGADTDRRSATRYPVPCSDRSTTVRLFRNRQLIAKGAVHCPIHSSGKAAHLSRYSRTE